MNFRNWRSYLHTRTPEGRLAIFAALLALLLLVSLLRTLVYGNPSGEVAALLGRIAGLLVGFTLHEWAHAYSAYRLGGYRALPDPSRLSLDPRVHLDPMGVILVVLVGFGWARPVPVYPQAFYPRERQGMMLVAVAGPLMNLAIALVAALLLRIFILTGALSAVGDLRPIGFLLEANSTMQFGFAFFYSFILLNVILLWFNLIPLSPLDGWKVLIGLLPNEQAAQLQRYERESMYLLFALIILGFFGLPSPIFAVLSPLVRLFMDVLV